MTNKEYVNEIVSETEFKIEEIFDYSNSPYLDNFSKVYEFYRKTLASNSERFSLNKSYILYLDNRSVNAKACSSEKYNIICINSGLIIFLIQNILEKKEIDEILKLDYQNVYNFLDNPINILMYQVSLHFTFYHELGHLVQKSEILKSYIYERPIESKHFNLKRHKLELDADNFSSFSIGTHIHQYAFKIFGENLNSNQFESVLEIFCSSILLYFLSFESYKDEIYYEESTHPHPIIRILNVIITITNYCKNSPKLKEKGIEINRDKIYDLTIQNTIKIENQINGTSKARYFNQILIDNKTEIFAYYEKLLVYESTDFIRATDKWNETLNYNYVD